MKYAEAMIPYWKFEANSRQYCDENGYDFVKVLAPVPSYEVYKELIDGRKLLREHIKDITNENAQLRELLKECREEIASVEWDSVANDRNQMKLLTKIDEALK